MPSKQAVLNCICPETSANRAQAYDLSGMKMQELASRRVWMGYRKKDDVKVEAGTSGCTSADRHCSEARGKALSMIVQLLAEQDCASTGTG